MEPKNKNRFFVLGIAYLGLSILFIFIVLKFGVTAAVKISELIQGNSSESSSSLSDVIVSPPQLSSIPEATNSAELKIWGFAPANQKVEIYLNENLSETTDVDSEGKFESFIKLSLGTNKIFGVSKNKDDVISPPSRSWTVFYGDTPPVLEITEPQNDIVTVRNKQAEIKGKIEKTSRLTINDRLVIIDSEGMFSLPVNLEPGENLFRVVCTDPAQNQSVREITFLLQP